MIGYLALDVGVQVRHKRKRSLESFTLRREFPVEIREASSSEAPIALWWRREDKGRDFVAYRVLDGEVYVPVFVEGKGAESLASDGREHVRPIEPRGDGEPPELPMVLSLDAYMDRLAQGISSIPRSVLTVKEEECTGSSSYPESVVDMDETNVDRTADQIADYFAMIIAVDGVVYRRIDMPLIHVDAFGPGFGNENSLTAGLFSCTGFEEARRYAEAVVNPRYATASIEDFRPDIVRPDIVPALDVLNVRRKLVARRILREPCSSRYGNSVHSHFFQAPRETLEAFSLLRQALEESGDWEGRLHDFLSTSYPPAAFGGDWLRDNLPLIDASCLEARRCP